jgi:hypothetical protein
VNPEAEHEDGQDEVEDPGWPIGFILMMGAVALYLGWRLIQGIALLVDWLR